MSSARLSSETGNPVPQPLRGPSIDLQQRTLKVTNIDSNVTKQMLHELFSQAGPVVNVVHKPEFAFIEFEDEESVGYAIALMDGIALYGSELQMQPKLQNRPEYYGYMKTLRDYEMTIACNPHQWWIRFGSRDCPMPNYLCRGASIPYTPVYPQANLSMHHQPVPIIHNIASNLIPHNYPPQYPPYQLNHSHEAFKRNNYSSPHETYHSRSYDNNYGSNGRYGDRNSPYSRPTENRYDDNRYGYSQSFNERNHRGPQWGHRRSN